MGKRICGDVLLVPIALKGHLNPMMYVAKMLMKRGLTLTMVISEDEASLMDSHMNGADMEGFNLELVGVEEERVRRTPRRRAVRLSTDFGIACTPYLERICLHTIFGADHGRAASWRRRTEVYDCGPVHGMDSELGNETNDSKICVNCFAGNIRIQILELATGLEASKESFLWVILLKQNRDGVTPDVKSLLPPGFLERTKDRGLVYPEFAPQLQILAHPAISGFLTHCGWNSLLESICRGVPMIEWPLQAEQKLC